MFPVQSKSRVLFLVAVLSWGTSCLAANDKPLPSADALLEDVRARLPRDPLTIIGELNVRLRKGIVAKSLGVQMWLNLAANPVSARYLIRDTDGNDLEQLSVQRKETGEPVFSYMKGAPLAAAAVPDLYAAIQGTDIGWMDLSLSFLWWSGGKTIRTEEVRGRACYVVEVPAPAGERATTGQYAKAILWIDEAMRMILQAEGYGSDGKLVRRLWVRSVKKVDETWMIKDLEIESAPFTHRTKLTVVDVVGPKPVSRKGADAGTTNTNSNVELLSL